MKTTSFIHRQDRRQFLIASATGTSIAVTQLCGLTPEVIGKNLDRWSLKESTAAKLIVNANTGVIHHRDVCAGHLPALKNQVKVANYTGEHWLHNHFDSRFKMIDAIADRLTQEDEITFLQSVIKRQPFAVHLHSRLRKVLGRAKRYEEIHVLYQNALTRARKSQGKNGRNSKAKRAADSFEQTLISLGKFRKLIPR